MLFNIYFAQVFTALRWAEKAAVALSHNRRGVTKYWRNKLFLFEAWKKKSNVDCNYVPPTF